MTTTTTTTTAKLGLNLMSLRADSRTTVRDLAAMIVEAARALGTSYTLGEVVAQRLRPFISGEFAGVPCRIVHAMPHDARDAFVAATNRGVCKAAWLGAFNGIKAAAEVEAKRRRDARNAERAAARTPAQVTADLRRVENSAAGKVVEADALIVKAREALARAESSKATRVERHAKATAKREASELAEVEAVINPDAIPATNVDLPASSTPLADAAGLTTLERDALLALAEASNGDFGFCDELDIPESVAGDKGMAALVGSLNRKGLIDLDSDAEVNGRKLGTTQYTIDEDTAEPIIAELRALVVEVVEAAGQPEATAVELDASSIVTEHTAARPDPASAAPTTWLVALRNANADASRAKTRLPFAGSPVVQGGTWKAGTYHELYKNGGTLRAFLADDGTEMARLTVPALPKTADEFRDELAASGAVEVGTFDATPAGIKAAASACVAKMAECKTERNTAAERTEAARATVAKRIIWKHLKSDDDRKAGVKEAIVGAAGFGSGKVTMVKVSKDGELAEGDLLVKHTRGRGVPFTYEGRWQVVLATLATRKLPEAPREGNTIAR